MNSLFRNSLVALAVSAALATGAVSAQALESERDRASYMVGRDIAQSLDAVKGEVDVAVMTRAIEDAWAGRPSPMTDAELEAVRQALIQRLQTRAETERAEAATRNLAEGEAFLAQNRGRAGVRTTESGLQYQVLRQGSGERPTAASTVTVHYVGTLLDGTKFDSSYDRNEPATFPLGGVIPGWTEGVQLMPVGSKFKFWIPGSLAYGEQGPPMPGGAIGPNQTLVFEVELISIQGGQPAGQ